MASVQISELKIMNSKLKNIKSNIDNNFTNLSTNLENFNGCVNNFNESNLASTNESFKVAFDAIKEQFNANVDSCIDFLNIQMKEYEISIEEAYNNLKVFMATIASSYNISLADVPNYSSEVDFYTINSGEEESIQLEIDSMINSASTLSNLLVSYEYIEKSISAAWISENNDNKSVIESIERCILELRNTIIPMINTYTRVFNDLLAAIQATKSESMGE